MSTGSRTTGEATLVFDGDRSKRTTEEMEARLKNKHGKQFYCQQVIEIGRAILD